jgi:hypothetical protein
MMAGDGLSSFSAQPVVLDHLQYTLTTPEEND